MTDAGDAVETSGWFCVLALTHAPMMIFLLYAALTVFEREMRKLLDEKREALKIERNEARTRRAQKTESITLLSAIERATPISRFEKPLHTSLSTECSFGVNENIAFKVRSPDWM